MLLGGCWVDLQVRLAVPDDVVALHGLMGDVSNAMQLQEAFLHAVGAWQAAEAVAQCDARFSAGALHTVSPLPLNSMVADAALLQPHQPFVGLAVALTYSECWY